MMQQALEMDIDTEVERRFNEAIEESRGLESGRSTTSDVRTGRTRKSVHF